jgi:hypothetical protein
LQAISLATAQSHLNYYYLLSRYLVFPKLLTIFFFELNGKNETRWGRGRDLNSGERLHRPLCYQATPPRPLFHGISVTSVVLAWLRNINIDLLIFVCGRFSHHRQRVRSDIQSPHLLTHNILRCCGLLCL